MAAEAREKEKQIEELKVAAVVFFNYGVATHPLAEQRLARRPVGEDTGDEAVHTEGENVPHTPSVSPSPQSRETTDVATNTAVAGNALSTPAVADASGSEVPLPAAVPLVADRMN